MWQIFFIIVLVVPSVLLYVLWQRKSKREHFAVDVGYTPMYDQHMPSVDGDIASKKSLYMFSNTECKPECCAHSSYSCDRGCMCMTQKQKDWINVRGANAHWQPLKKQTCTQMSV